MSFTLAPLSLPKPFWRAPARTAPGCRVLAVGDIHGCGRLMIEMMRAYRRVAKTDLPTAEQQEIIVLGDFIDRGPLSLPVLRALHSYRTYPNFTVLLGNHEATLIDCIDGKLSALDDWLDYGGDAFLDNLALQPPGPWESHDHFRQRLAETIGEPIVDWLRDLPLNHMSGDYYFCHAGVRPGVPLPHQKREDLLWIRSAFVNSRRFHGKVIVHGHTVHPTVLALPNRIGVDTGAYSSGQLSGVILQDDMAWSLTVSA